MDKQKPGIAVYKCRYCGVTFRIEHPNLGDLFDRTAEGINSGATQTSMHICGADPENIKDVAERGVSVGQKWQHKRQ